MSDYRELTLRGAANGTLRTATFRQREHIVVPVVALVEGVVHAVNSPHPELVLAQEFGRAIDAWNGEPVMLDHPDIGGQKVSANQPAVLEASQLGQIFHTKVVGKRLLMEAYIDPKRVDEVGEQAQRLLEILRSGGTIEVSVGAFITAEHAEGSFNGKPYHAIWRDIVPDHLALLPEGATGACSNTAGCGAGVARAARSAIHIVTASGIHREGEEPMADDKKPEGRSLRQRIGDMVKSLMSSKGVRVAAETPEGTSDMDLRRSLDSALRSTEPAYLGIDAVFPDDSLVIYAVAPNEVMQIIQRNYTLTDGEVSLGDERIEVEPVMRYEPVAAAAAPRTSCGCPKKTESADSAPVTGERLVHKNAERITALIANSKTVWTEADRAYLETIDDNRLSTLESAATTPEPAAVKPELKLEDLPEPWRKAIEAHSQAEQTEKATAVETLAAAQSAFSKADLEAMPLDQLKKLSALAAATPKPTVPPTSFVGRSASAPVVASADDSTAPPPPDMNARLAAARAK